jgi:hypothetical protein
MSAFISTIRSIPCKWNNVCLIMQCRHFNHTWIFMTLLCMLCGVKCHIRQHLYCYKVKRDWMRHNRTRVRIWLWIIFIANDTDTVTQITLLTQAAHSGLTKLTVHLLLYAVQGFMGVQWFTTDSSIPYYWSSYKFQNVFQHVLVVATNIVRESSLYNLCVMWYHILW